MGVIERKRVKCGGKSVGPCSLIIIIILFSSVTALSHKLGHVEPLPKESVGGGGGGGVNHNNNRGVGTTRRLQSQYNSTSSTTSRDGLFGTKINRNPSLFLHIPQLRHNGSTRSYLSHRQSDNNNNDMMTMMMREEHPKFPPSSSSEMDTSDDDDDEGRNGGPDSGPLSTGSIGNGRTSTIKTSTIRGTSSITSSKSSSSSKKNYPNHHHQNISMEDSSSWKPTMRISDTTATNMVDQHHGGNNNNNKKDSIDFKSTMMAGFLKREVWTIPLLAIASVNIFLISLFEIYVLCKARGPSRRHLFLGQMLLFALFFCSTLASIFAICPSTVGCFLGRLGLGIAYTLIFSVLMVKCVFLLSLDSGVYLPASYQACLLLFSVLVQVAIDVQWVVVYPFNLQVNQVGSPLWPQCGTSYSHLLLTLSYNVFLIVVVGILAFKTRGIRENYRESTYIGISILVTVPIWISWTIAGWILQDTKQDACVAFGLLAQSLATFLIMFMPKGRQLAAMGKDGMYLEDQDTADCCSGYSPSFFHFKPSKSYKTALIGDALNNGHFYRFCNDYNAQFYYPPPSKADGNVYTTLEPTISTINPNVFFHRSDPHVFHPGMIY